MSISLNHEPSGRPPGKKSPRDLLNLLERHFSKSSPVTDEQAHAAQQLVYDAWEAPNEAQARKLIQQALELDPTNVDALLKAGVYAGLSGEAKIELLRKVVALGEKSLGPKIFRECAGAFWGLHETRPYMRARQQLAETLRAGGHLEEAVAEFVAMLKLNPSDNQGLRYTLLPLYLLLSRLEDARKLLAEYPEAAFSAVFGWSHVLERFLTGDLPAATKALAVARQQNPHMQAYIQGKRKIPAFPPSGYAPGSQEEAFIFAESMHTAWAKHPSALRWLASQK